MRLRTLTAAAVLAVTAAGGLVSACADEPSASAQAPPLPANPDQVVAEVGGRRITLKEVDDKWEEFDAAERARVTQLMYQNRRNMIELMVGDALLENAAKAAGQTVEAYVAAQSAKLVTPVTDAEVREFYEQNKDRAQGRTFEQLKDQIRPFLESQRQQQGRAQVVAALKANGAVKVMLEPPRYTVALAGHDPIRGESTAPITVVEYSDYQ
jgi:hypothetical protein